MKSVVEGEELSHMVAGVWPLRVTMATMVNVIIFNQARGGGAGMSKQAKQVWKQLFKTEGFCSSKLFKNCLSIK